MAIPNLSTLNEIALVVLGIVVLVLAHEAFLNWAHIVRLWDHVWLFRYNKYDDFIRACRKCGATHVAYTVRTDEQGYVVGWWRTSAQGNDPKCRCTLYVRQPTNPTPEDPR